MAADLILPTAMWIEKEGAYGNAERRSQFWRQQTKGPGESRSDLWQIMEFAKRFKTDEVWPKEFGLLQDSILPQIELTLPGQIPGEGPEGVPLQ